MICKRNIELPRAKMDNLSIKEKKIDKNSLQFLQVN